MAEHLSIDELMDFIDAQTVDSNFFALAAKVNSHIHVCAACRETYETLLSLEETISELTGQDRLLQQEHNFVVKKLAQVKQHLQNAGLSIAGLKEGWSFLSLNVKSLRSVECDIVDSLHRLYHPPYFAVAKSIRKTTSGRTVQPPMIKSTLTDGHGSRITVGEDGTLSFFLSIGSEPGNTLVALVPNGDNVPVQVKRLEPCDEKTFSVHFDNILPGEYFATVLTTAPFHATN